MSNTVDLKQTEKCEQEFMGHPKGLAYIVFTEAWERFSFYGMQALLVLYMVRYLYLDGNIEQVAGFETFKGIVESIFGTLSNDALAKQTAGLYIGLIYFFPVFGGLLGDKVIGRTRAVLLGAVFMAIGHFLMAFEHTFLLALSALILGSGLLKGNLAAQVGGLYKRLDQRRDTAFSVYNVAINIGATIAPLVCGTLGELYGWHYGFGAAGIGMLVGITIYWKGRRYLPADNIDKTDNPIKELTRNDGKIVAAIVLIILLAAFYWTVQSQVWITYPLWIAERVDHTLFGWSMPVTWFQSIDNFAVLIFAPIVIWRWRILAQRELEPAVITKLIKGFFTFAFAYGLIIFGEWLANSSITSGQKVHIIWPVLFHLICGWGFMHLGPIFMALISRTAPVSINTMMVSGYYLSIFAGGTLSGWLGKFYETMSPIEFWLMHIAIVSSGGILIWLLSKPLTRLLFSQERVVD
ncbi:MAG: peptide MFS transporter [Kangiellaceae bacterium]|nr:peptide MFS transporter [Kangiellaceae bacterium]